MRHKFIMAVFFSFALHAQADTLNVQFTCTFGPRAVFNSWDNPRSFNLSLSNDPEDTTDCSIIQPNFLDHERLIVCLSKDGAGSVLLDNTIGPVSVSLGHYQADATLKSKCQSVPTTIKGRPSDSLLIHFSQDEININGLDEKMEYKRMTSNDEVTLKVDYTLGYYKNFWGKGKASQRVNGECKVIVSKQTTQPAAEPAPEVVLGPASIL